MQTHRYHMSSVLRGKDHTLHRILCHKGLLSNLSVASRIDWPARLDYRPPNHPIACNNLIAATQSTLALRYGHYKRRKWTRLFIQRRKRKIGIVQRLQASLQ